MMKRLLLILAIVCMVSAGLLLWRYWNIANDQGIAPGTVDSTAPATGGNTPPPAPNAGIPPVPSPSGVSPAFVTFLQTEARSLDSTKVNAEAAEQNVAEQAALMGENEIRYARDLALGPQNPANQRILAAFLLGAAGAKGRPACGELILATTNSNRAEPDSIDELKNVQSKSISLMCVDAIADAAKTDRTAREDLRRLAAQVKDSTIKNHIAERIRTLPSL